MFLWNEVENFPYLLRACFPKAKAAMLQENVVTLWKPRQECEFIWLTQSEVSCICIIPGNVLWSSEKCEWWQQREWINFSNGQHLSEKQEHGTAFFQTAFPGKVLEWKKVRKGLCKRSRS